MMPPTMATHWAVEYIGQPWVRGEHDCWAFARRIWAAHYGLDVPAIGLDTHNALTIARALRDHDERQHWVPVEVPRDGDAVLMAHARHPSHVGVWIEAAPAGVLHCTDPAGVVFATPSTLQRCGWSKLEFYRHATRMGAAA